MPSKTVVDKPENEKADLPTPAVEKEAITKKQPSQPAELKESSDTNEQESKSKEPHTHTLTHTLTHTQTHTHALAAHTLVLTHTWHTHNT